MKQEHVWALLVLTFGGILLALTGSFHYQAIAAFEHGYCEVQNYGSSGTHWTKCEEKK